MSYPIFSILKDFKDSVVNHSSYNTKIDELTAELTAIQGAIAAQSLTSTNNVNIAFSGSAIFDQLLDPGVLVVANSTPPREVITGKSVIRRTTDNHVEVVDFTMVNGDADLVLFNNGGDIAHLIFNNGLVQIKHAVVANNLSLQATLLFYTQPAIGTGIVGPAGVDGIDGIDGEIIKTPWANLAYGTSWEDASPVSFFVGQYRKFDDVVQLSGLVQTSSSRSSYPVIATLPADFRPSRQVILSTISYNNVFCRVDVKTNGEITWLYGGSGWLSLDGIQFRLNY